MKKISLIFPHQLFKDNPCIIPGIKVCIIEETLFFRQYPFHKQKIAFHRASMKYYQDYLIKKGFNTEYIESHKNESDIQKLITRLKTEGVIEIHFTEVVDNWLNKRLKKSAGKYSIKLVEYQSPGFLNTLDELRKYFGERKKLFQTRFYKDQRLSRHILIDPSGRPAGGKWTYDNDNRKKYPSAKKAPSIKFPEPDNYHKESIVYTKKHFSDHYGKLNENIRYPHTHKDALEWLNQFLNERFRDFGTYEDAIVKEEYILNHSILSPLLNTGLITLAELIKVSLTHAEGNDVPLNSLEGFIRQILGWREFIRAVYELKGTEERTRNFWGFNKKIPESFWNGTTGIEPVDMTIKKLLETGYNHHIERLMILGNFMLLCEFDPNEVYQWFMTMYIDAYDWVMVPNVYGMSQFADGGIMSTKPYISSSNYILKMSNFKKGPWTDIWDALFWRFLDKQREFFRKNPRMRMLISTFDKMQSEKQRMIWKKADNFLSRLN